MAIVREVYRDREPLFPDTSQPDVEELVVQVGEHMGKHYLEVIRETYNPERRVQPWDPNYGLLFEEQEIDRAEKIANAILEAVKFIRSRQNAN